MYINSRQDNNVLFY